MDTELNTRIDIDAEAKQFDDCYTFIEKLDRADLIDLLKYEIQMRYFLQDEIYKLKKFLQKERA